MKSSSVEEHVKTVLLGIQKALKEADEEAGATFQGNQGNVNLG